MYTPWSTDSSGVRTYYARVQIQTISVAFIMELQTFNASNITFHEKPETSTVERLIKTGTSSDFPDLPGMRTLPYINCVNLLYCTLHLTLYSEHCTLRPKLFNVHCRQITIHCILQTVNCTQKNVQKKKKKWLTADMTWIDRDIITPLGSILGKYSVPLQDFTVKG